MISKMQHWLSIFFAFKDSSVQPTSKLPRSILFFLAFLVLCKFILTAQEEMLTFFLPHDDLWQVRAAARTYWGGAYGPDKLFHLPVFPLFMAAMKIVGIPLRIALEAFYCGAACFLAVSLWRMGSSTPVTMLAAFVLIFNPASFQLPNRCGAEILLAPLMMGAIAATLLWWNVRDRRNSLQYGSLAGVFWALAWNVRKESTVLIPVIVVLFMAVILVDRKAGWTQAVRSAIVGVGFIMFACLLMEHAIKGANWMRWGLYTTSIQTSSGYKSAVKALQSIRPESPLDYIPVPVEVRRRAYAVSPAFAELKPYLEGNVGRGWSVHSRPFTDGKGLTKLDEMEISAGWFYWALYDAVVAAGHGSSPKETDRYFAQIGSEINRAIKDGRLSGRWVPVAMVDPALMKWLPRLPESLHRVGSTFIKPAVPDRPIYDGAVEQACGPVFDKITNRRSYLTANYRKAEAHGWASASDGSVLTVEIRSTTALLGHSSLDVARPDVDPVRNVGFNLSMIVPSENIWRQAEIVALLADGRMARHPLSNFSPPQLVNIPVGKTVVHLAVDSIQKPDFKPNRLWKAQKHLETWYLTLQRWLLWPGLFAGLAAFVLLIYRPCPVDLAIVILTITVVTRVAFFAILDACAWPGDQPRYLFAAYPLFSLLLLLVFARMLTLPCLWKKDYEIRLQNKYE